MPHPGRLPCCEGSLEGHRRRISRLQARILAREKFLAAVTGNPESVENAEEVISIRLQAG